MTASARNGRTRILILDDHPVVRHGLRLLLSGERDLEVCGEAASEIGALEQADAHQPDLVLVDLSLREGSGLELIKRLRSREDGTRLLVVSMHDETLLAERAIDAGAHGYVGKAEATELLVQAVRTVLAGKIYLSPAMTERLLALRAGAGSSRGTGVARLSDRELEVFGKIGAGQSTREIAESLRLSVKTVETHRENIKRKLELESGLALMREAMQWTLLGK